MGVNVFVFVLFLFCLLQPETCGTHYPEKDPWVSATGVTSYAIICKDGGLPTLELALGIG